MRIKVDVNLEMTWASSGQVHRLVQMRESTKCDAD